MFGFLCFTLAGLFLLGFISYFYALRPQSTFPILSNLLKDPLASSAQLSTLDEQKTQTDLWAHTLGMMGPLTELKTSIIKSGSGPTVAKGQRVTVHATGSVLQADGSAKKFWSTKDPGQQPFTWQAGLGQVIAGWDQGVLGMSLGETRMIHIPAKMGYGTSGFPAWGIPPNADLQFEIECLQIQ